MLFCCVWFSWTGELPASFKAKGHARETTIAMALDRLQLACLALCVVCLFPFGGCLAGWSLGRLVAWSLRGWVCGWMDGWVGGWVGGWVAGWSLGRLVACGVGLVDGWVGGCWLVGWLVGVWVGGLVGWWVGGLVGWLGA